MANILNTGALNLAMAVGYRTGLFEAMASFSVPRSAAAIAAQSGLNARYVREWLGVMFTGDVVELVIGEDGIERYLLPPEHAAFLVKSTGNANLAVYTQEIPLLTACAMEPVIRAFQTGEGVPYSVYPRFQAFMSELAQCQAPAGPAGEVPAIGGGRPSDGAAEPKAFGSAIWAAAKGWRCC